MRRALVLASALLAGCGTTEVDFSNLRVEDVSATRAVVRFESNVEVSCEAQYGTSPDALTLTATDPNMAPGQLELVHRVSLEDLAPETTYHYRASALDEDGNRFVSGTATFTTHTSTVQMGRNAALLSEGGAIAEVSSNWNGAPNGGLFGAESAIDGKMSTEWSSNGDGDGAFVVIALPRAVAIDRIAFRSREMTDGTSIIRSILIEPEGASAIGPLATPDPSVRYEFMLPVVVTAQRWRVRAVETTTGNTGAREIELWTMEPR